MAQTHNRAHLIFFFLAVSIILVGHGLITETDDFLHGAAVAKTGKAYIKPTNDSTSNATTAEPQNQTSASTASNSNVASRQQNQPGNYIKQSLPSYGYSIHQPNQSNTSEEISPSTENVSSLPPPEETLQPNETATPPPQSEMMNASNHTINVSAPPTLEASVTAPKPAPKIEEKMKLEVNITPFTGQMPQIILTISNPTSAPLQIQPKVEEIPSLFANEARIQEILTAELQSEATINIPEKVKEKLEILAILEKENVKPVYIRKIYRPFEFISAAVTYTGKRTSGQQLKLPALASVTVLPREKKQVRVNIPPSLSAVGRKVQFSVLADGDKVYTANLTLHPSFSTVIDVDQSQHLLDLYLFIPKEKGNRPREYMLEMQIGEPRKEYYEVFGPYKVSGDESALFSQQFQYDPAKIRGKKTVVLTLIKDGSVVQQVRHEVNFDEGNI